MSERRSTVLFTGYAPVHVVCFLPIYRRLAARADVEILLSGGIRSHGGETYQYDLEGLYEPLGVDPDHLVTVEELAELDVDVPVCANTNRLEPRSAHHTVEMFHGMSFRNRAVRPSASSDPDHYWVLGPYQHRRIVEAGLVSEGDPRAVPIGFPKTDALLDGSLDRDETLARFGFTGHRPVVLYAPTGAKYNSMKTMGKRVIRALRDTGRYDLLIKPHDHSHDGVDWFERLAPHEDAHTRLVHDADVIPSLHAADLLISDASSVSNEYALLDRPMVFLDVPRLLIREIERGTPVDLTTWGRKAGPVAADADKAVQAVEAELADPHRTSTTRRELVEDLFYHPGQASQAAVRWLDELLDSAPVGAVGDVGA